MRMTAKIKDFREILLPHSDCGHEREYAEMMAEKLRAYTDADKVTVDPMNNVIAYIGDPEKYTIMLEAHIDEISLIVQDITEEGFLKVKNVGGVDRRTLPASEVKVNGLPGIVCNIPPHLSSDPRKVPEYEDLYIDLGLPADEVRKNVKKALRNDLEILIEAKTDHLDEFLRIYNGTMDRNDAKTYY